MRCVCAATSSALRRPVICTATRSFTSLLARFTASSLCITTSKLRSSIRLISRLVSCSCARNTLLRRSFRCRPSRDLKSASLTSPRTRSFSGSNLVPAGSLASCFSARRAEAVKRSSSIDRMLGEEVSAPGGEQAGDQIGLRADLDHRLHHLHAALDQRAHRDVAALADVLRGGDHLEIAVVHDRRELVADPVVRAVQRGEPRVEAVADFRAVRDRLLQRLEVFLQALRHRLGDGEAAAVALADAQPVHDGVEVARAARDLRGDQLAVVGALRRDVARSGGRDFAGGDRQPQCIGHHRHFAGRDALEAALGIRERHDRDRGGDHRHDGDRAERGLQTHLDAEFALAATSSRSSSRPQNGGPRRIFLVTRSQPRRTLR